MTGSLKRAVESAEGIARVQEPDPDRLPMANADEGKQDGPAPSRWVEKTAAVTPADRAAVVGGIVGVAKKNDLVTAGIYATSETADAVVNSNGLSVFHRQTAAEISITMLAGDSSGWQKANYPDVRNLQPLRMAEADLDLALF